MKKLFVTLFLIVGCTESSPTPQNTRNLHEEFLQYREQCRLTARQKCIEWRDSHYPNATFANLKGENMLGDVTYYCDIFAPNISPFRLQCGDSSTNPQNYFCFRIE